MSSISFGDLRSEIAVIKAISSLRQVNLAEFNTSKSIIALDVSSLNEAFDINYYFLQYTPSCSLLSLSYSFFSFYFSARTVAMQLRKIALPLHRGYRSNIILSYKCFSMVCLFVRTNARLGVGYCDFQRAIMNRNKEFENRNNRPQGIEKHL